MSNISTIETDPGGVADPMAGGHGHSGTGGDGGPG